MLDLDHEQGIKKLKAALSPADSQLRSKLEVLEVRLYDNVSATQTFGTDENVRSDYARIMHELNTLSHTVLDSSFIDLCKPAHTTAFSSFFQETPTVEPPQLNLCQSWANAMEIPLKGEIYILSNPVLQQWSKDHSALEQRARALQGGRKAWLKQVCITHPSSQALTLHTLLQKESRLLTELEQGPRNDFPRLLDFESNSQVATIAYTITNGTPLQQIFARQNKPLDQSSTLLLLRSMTSLRALLALLHQKGYSHRELTPETVLLQEGKRAVLQDLGLAAHSFEVGEGPPLYQAPEQSGDSRAVPGPHTDIYQLGLLLYHLLIGELPTSLPLPDTPPAQWSNEYPLTLYTALQRATMPATKKRWRTIHDFASALRQATDDIQQQMREKNV